MKETVIPIVVGALGTVTKRLVKRQEDLEIKGRVETNYSIVEIGQDTEKSPGNLRRLVIKIPVNDHRLTLMWETLIE